MYSIRTQIQSELTTLNEQGKTPMEMAQAVIEKLVEVRYRMLELYELNQQLVVFINSEPHKYAFKPTHTKLNPFVTKMTND